MMRGRRSRSCVFHTMALLPLLLLLLLGAATVVEGQQLVRSRNSDDWKPRSRSGTCVPRDCKLPDCFCAGTTAPSHMRNYQIPQMVMLTFDDAINEQVFGFYEKLFLDGGRKNPNGCPISATFYLSHNWTDYDMVRRLYEGGHELATHSVTHRMPQSWWTAADKDDWHRELDGQRDNIVRLGGLPRDQVIGMRVPFLELGGDKQFTMMADVGIKYDSSFMTGPYDEGGAWPFTLDYPPNWKYCSNNNCPKSSFPGTWELPMNRWIGPDGKPCPMVDACQSQPVDKQDALGFMWYNFNRHYRGNRAPFGIHLHAVWFKQDPGYLDALAAFLDAIAALDDVYLVTASQIVSWMEDPHPAKEAVDFLPWRRSCLMSGEIAAESGGEIVPEVAKAEAEAEAEPPEVALPSTVDPTTTPSLPTVTAAVEHSEMSTAVTTKGKMEQNDTDVADPIIPEKPVVDRQMEPTQVDGSKLYGSGAPGVSLNSLGGASVASGYQRPTRPPWREPTLYPSATPMRLFYTRNPKPPVSRPRPPMPSFMPRPRTIGWPRPRDPLVGLPKPRADLPGMAYPDYNRVSVHPDGREIDFPPSVADDRNNPAQQTGATKNGGHYDRENAIEEKIGELEIDLAEHDPAAKTSPGGQHPGSRSGETPKDTAEDTLSVDVDGGFPGSAYSSGRGEEAVEAGRLLSRSNDAPTRHPLTTLIATVGLLTAAVCVTS